MAVYIVDASVVMHYLMADTYTRNARAFFGQIGAEERLVVPEFCLMECTNVFWKQVRFHGMHPSVADNLLTDLYRLPLSRMPVKRLMRSTLQIGLRRQLAVYDSPYLSRAAKTKAPLLTADQPQTTAAVAEGIVVIPLAQYAS